MKKIIITVIFSLSLFVCSKTEAQTIQYYHDQAGNRYMRKPCLTCRSIPNPPDTTGKPKPSIKTAAEEGISVFPNPTQNTITVNISTYKAEESTKLLVANESGKILLTQDVKNQNTQLDFGSFTEGVYYVRIMKGKNQLSYKVLKVQ